MTVRVFAPPAAAFEAGAQLELEPEEAHYLSRVRRVRPGAAVEVNDGEDWWSATVIEATPRRASVTLHGPRPASPALPPWVLLLGLPDPKTVLELLPGACEIGADEVILVRCERSQTDGPGISRIARVLRASIRQCGRPRTPRVRGPLPLEEAVSHHPALPGVVAVASLRAQTDEVGSVRGRLASPRGARVAVGPEGGFTPTEVEACVAAGLHPVSLGPWVLRTQTAALVLLAAASVSHREGP